MAFMRIYAFRAFISDLSLRELLAAAKEGLVSVFREENSI